MPLLLLSSVSILLIDHPARVTSVLWPLKCVSVFSQCHPIRALHSSLGLESLLIGWRGDCHSPAGKDQGGRRAHYSPRRTRERGPILNILTFMYYNYTIRDSTASEISWGLCAMSQNTLILFKLGNGRKRFVLCADKPTTCNFMLSTKVLVCLINITKQ